MFPDLFTYLGITLLVLNLVSYLIMVTLLNELRKKEAQQWSSKVKRKSLT